METVKVDIQKLQLLNERIAQTIDALNQLRMSAHGIQHTPAVTPWGYGQPYGAYATPQVPFVPSYYGAPVTPQSFVSPYALSPSFTGSPFGGLQHTTSPIASPLGTWSMPYVGNGISHSTFDPTRTQTWQTWPWFQSPWTVTVT
jgi:hypothetical protein